MNHNTVRNLLAAVLALSATALTTQTIVHAAPRPYSASDASIVQPRPDARAHLALCAGLGRALC